MDRQQPELMTADAQVERCDIASKVAQLKTASDANTCA